MLTFLSYVALGITSAFGIAVLFIVVMFLVLLYDKPGVD